MNIDKLSDRHYKLAEYVQALFKEKLLKDGEPNNVAITSLFLSDLRVIAEYIKHSI